MAPEDEKEMTLVAHKRLIAGLWLACCAALPAAVATPETWNFDIYTTGQPAYWTSPTAVDPTADWYVASWEITLLEVTLKPPFFPQFTIDITDQIPPEDRVGIDTALGPAPIIVFQDHVRYPPPPDPVGFECDLELGLNATGHGYMNMTNVVLGTVVYQGITMQVKKVRIAGTVTAEAFHGSTVLGDLNCDYAVDFDDINSFVLALSGFIAYHDVYPTCNWLNADCNQDGVVDFADIDAFIAALTR